MKSANLRAIGAAVATLASVVSGAALADTVYGNNGSPGDSFTNASATNTGQAVGTSGWYYNNVRNSGIVGINTNYARDGNGSANLSTTQGPSGASSKADIEFLANAVEFQGNWFATDSMGSFRNLFTMSYDWYRNSSSSNDPGQHPAMRVLLDLDGDLNTFNDRGGLVYEQAYNTGGAAATDTWINELIDGNSKVWNFGLGLGTAFDIDGSGSGYDNTLAQWQASGRLADALIVGFSVGVGSGWGPFDGAVDNVSWAIGDGSMSSNFEVDAAAVPLPGTWSLLSAGLFGLAWTRRRR